MEQIRFENVLPQVFATRDDLVSEIWRKDICFQKGNSYLVEAESGKGKSTFCSYILGYRNDYTGRVLFDNNDTRCFSIAEWTDIRKHLFQELRLFPELTAMENVEIKNCLTNWKTRKEIEEWFERLGIADKMNAKIGRMSFGQQQRVALIRSLVQPFDFILADEPVSHLDERNSQVLGEILMEESVRQGAGVIVTSIGKHVEIDYTSIVKL